MRWRFFIKHTCRIFFIAWIFLSLTGIRQAGAQAKSPNILFIISDDQGYPHTSAYGCSFVNTPVFDRIAKERLLFTHFFITAPEWADSILKNQELVLICYN